MVEWARELPVVVKAVASFVGGLFTASVTILTILIGPIKADVAEHTHDIMEVREDVRILKDGNAVVVCYVWAQINQTDEKRCLFDPYGERR